MKNASSNMSNLPLFIGHIAPRSAKRAMTLMTNNLTVIIKTLVLRLMDQSLYYATLPE